MQAILLPTEKAAKGSLYSDQLLVIPDWQHGETRPIVVALADRIESPLTARILEPRNISGWSFRAALGKGFLLPVAGSFTITFGADTTAAIVFNPTALQLSTALNALASIVAAGGVTITGENGFFVINFGSNGARATLVGDPTDLAPLSVTDFGTLIDGDAGRPETQILRLVQNPGAYTSLTLFSDPPAAGVIPVQAGGGGLNAKARVSLLSRQSGLLTEGAQYTIENFVAGDDFTNLGGTNVTGNTFTSTGTTPTTWTNKSTLTRVDVNLPYDGKFSVSVAGLESALIDFGATGAVVQAALEAISISSGVVVTGRKYKIVSFAAGDDFTNIGGTNATGNVFVASGTTPTTWTHSSVLSPVGAGNVFVARESAGRYLIGFQGDMANTAMGTLTADGSALAVLMTFAGVLDLRTAGIDLLLNGQTSTPITFEIEGTPPGGTVQKLFRSDGTLIDSIIDPSNTTTPNVVNRSFLSWEYTAGAIADGRFKTDSANIETTNTITISDVAKDGGSSWSGFLTSPVAGLMMIGPNGVSLLRIIAGVVTGGNAVLTVGTQLAGITGPWFGVYSVVPMIGLTEILAGASIAPTADATVTPVTSITTESGIVTGAA